METKIPKIIHQIWSGLTEPLPEYFQELGNTWKENHPDWQYEFWDNARMNQFILEYYPHYWETYNRFPYNVQRWDAIRYLILDKIGGMYVDFDYECIKPLDDLLEGKTCCFSMEPNGHCVQFGRTTYFNNALMAAVPEHPFMKKIMEKTFSYNQDITFTNIDNKIYEVLLTTGPLMMSQLYDEYEEKENVYLLPAEFVSPFTKQDTASMLSDENTEKLEKKLENAYAVHYFLGGWLRVKNANT